MFAVNAKALFFFFSLFSACNFESRARRVTRNVWREWAACPSYVKKRESNFEAFPLSARPPSGLLTRKDVSNPDRWMIACMRYVPIGTADSPPQICKCECDQGFEKDKNKKERVRCACERKFDLSNYFGASLNFAVMEKKSRTGVWEKTFHQNSASCPDTLGKMSFKNLSYSLIQDCTIQICPKSLRIGCVILRCKVQCWITQPNLQLFWACH